MTFKRRLATWLLRDERRPRRGVRTYQAAQADRLTADWLIAPQTADQEIKVALVPARSRARDLVHNDGYARRFVNLVRTNVVGPDGFKLTVQAVEQDGKPDALANTIIQGAFKDWARKRNASVAGDLSFRGIQALAVEMLARDGEVFVMKRYPKGAKYRFQLQVLDADQVDENANFTAKSGNRVVMGIEFDADNRPVNYYLKKGNQKSVNGTPGSTGDWTVIPAGAIYHIFVKERPYQSRGITWFAPSILRAKMLSGFEDAALVNARVGASKMGFLYSEPDQGAGQYVGDDQDASGNTITEVAPGTVEQLPTGLKFQGFDPQFPDSAYSDYVKGILRGIASGLGVSYNSLANDLEGVNYSSIRAGLLDERELWKELQAFFVESFLEDVYMDWLDAAITAQVINLPASKLFKFQAHKWTGRRWSWVDPASDVKADTEAVGQGFKSRTMVLAERGLDRDEVFAEIAAENDAAAALGLEWKDEAGAPQAPASDDQEDGSDDERKPTNGQ